MVPTHTYTQREKEFSSIAGNFFLFIEFSFRQLFPEKVFCTPHQSYLKVLPELNPKCALSTHFSDSPAKMDFFSFQWRRKFTLNFESSTFFHPVSLLFGSFCCFDDYHEQISSKILQLFDLFTSLWSSFWLVKIFSSHKNFLLHSNFDQNFARKRIFLTVNRLNWLLVII